MDAFRAAVMADDGDAAYEAAVALARGRLREPGVRLALQVLTGDRLVFDRAETLAELGEVDAMLEARRTASGD